MEFFLPIFFIFFFGILAVWVFMAVRGISQWNKNNHSPRLTVQATVVSKRADVSHSQHPTAGDASGAHGYYSTSHSTYYVTFEVASGDRMEFSVSGSEFGMMAEGDFGDLTFQGTRYICFTRL